jgi:hypothetical protein
MKTQVTAAEPWPGATTPRVKGAPRVKRMTKFARAGMMNGSLPVFDEATREDAAVAFSTSDRARHPVARCCWCLGPFVKIFEKHWICASEACALRQLAGSIRRDIDIPGEESPYLFVPLPRQIDIEYSTVPKLLVAGAAGTSKSYGARWLAYKFCHRIPGARVLIVRCTYDQLNKNHLQYMPNEAYQLGARYTGGNVRQMAFGNGAIIYAGYCQNESDIPQWVGPEFDLVLVEEGVNFLPEAIAVITSRARGSEPARAAMQAAGYTGGFSRILSNPGGRAMLYLQDHYINKNPDREEYPHYDASQFDYISTTLDDNPYLDPTYVARNLSHLSAARYAQLRHGDWSVYAGQFFEAFSADIHVSAMEARPA